MKVFLFVTLLVAFLASSAFGKHTAHNCYPIKFSRQMRVAQVFIVDFLNNWRFLPLPHHLHCRVRSSMCKQHSSQLHSMKINIPNQPLGSPILCCNQWEDLRSCRVRGNRSLSSLLGFAKWPISLTNLRHQDLRRGPFRRIPKGKHIPNKCSFNIGCWKQRRCLVCSTALHNQPLSRRCFEEVPNFQWDHCIARQFGRLVLCIRKSTENHRSINFIILELQNRTQGSMKRNVIYVVVFYSSEVINVI